MTETVTAIGVVATPRGLTQQHDLAGTPEPFTLPAANYRHLQDGPIPVLVEHDEGFAVGTCVALVRSRADGLLAVLRIDGPVVDLLADGDWYLSPGVRTRAGVTPLERDHARLFEVSLTRDPATLNTKALRWSRHDIATDGGGQPNGMSLSWRTAWDRVHEALQRRAYRRADRLWIIDLDPPVVIDAPKVTPTPVRARQATSTATVAPPLDRVYRHRVGGRLTLADD